MIKDFLLGHSDTDSVSFHMPGHKGCGIYRKYGYGDFLGRIMDCDITEIPGADNLFQPEGIIKSTMEKYTFLYGVKQSYLLINGTSGGIIASVLASVSKGKKLVMARNCHKSVFNALSLSGALPVYAYPEVVEGISGAVSAGEIKELLRRHGDAEAVILPSPNYYGICSDIKSISDVCREFGKILIVDQAHGAHLKFFSEYAPGFGAVKSAEECGADLIINSTHKTLASFTQSAVLNLNSDRVDRYVLEDKLQMVQSTSPSYILMASLDINADILKDHGRELITGWAENIDGFYERTKQIPAIKLIQSEGMLDRTKINIDMSAYGMDGLALEKHLRDKNIFAELSAGDILMCMSGIGNSKKDMDRLVTALKDISHTHEAMGVKEDEVKGDFGLWDKRRVLRAVPEKKVWTQLYKSAGKICASCIIPYPPGIPLLCPGEEIGIKDAEFIEHLRSCGKKVIGVNDRGEILTGI